MKFNPTLHTLRTLFLTLCLATWLTPVLSWGEEIENAAELFSPGQDQIVSTSRIPRPTSRTAENITVITAEDISRINAHTLAEVLQAVPGIQLDYLRTPSTFSFYSIQGTPHSTVLLLIDGIRVNNFNQGIAIPGFIPVQQIERIEIVKGAASAVWGSALGGVINVVTKTPNPERAVSGMASGSIGSRFTADSRAEASGTLNRFAYYLTAGNLHSDGLSPNTATKVNNLYGKLNYLLPGNGTATLGLSQLTAKPGMDEGDTAKWGFVHDNNEYRHSNGFLKFNQPLGNSLNLDIDVHVTSQDFHSKWGGRDGHGAIVFFNDNETRDAGRGANAKLSWGNSQRNLTAGLEYGRMKSRFADLLSADPPAAYREWSSWALYANGAYSIGSLTILPGVRHDKTGIAGENNSYTLGATYQLTENTTLRAYGSKGFSLPMLANDSILQKITTIQGGVESGAVPYFWLKGTYFYNTQRNSQSMGAMTITNQDRQGFEVEARTVPISGFSLASGYTYVYVINSDTGERLQTNSDQTVPPHLVKLALNYDRSDLGLRSTLAGNYVWWNSPAAYQSSSAGMIWDLHLNWKLKTESRLTPELFFTGHNLFNGVQTTDTELYKNAQRWFEGGVRVNF